MSNFTFNVTDSLTKSVGAIDGTYDDVIAEAATVKINDTFVAVGNHTDVKSVASKAKGIVDVTVKGTPTELTGADLNSLANTDSVKFIVTDDATIANITSMLARTKETTGNITFDSGKYIKDDLSNFASSDGTTTTFTTAFKNASKATSDSVALKMKSDVKVGPSDNAIKAFTDLVKDYTEVTATLKPLANNKGLGEVDKSIIDALASAHTGNDRIGIDFGTILNANIASFNTLRQKLKVNVEGTITDLTDTQAENFKGHSGDKITITMANETKIANAVRFR